MIDININKKKLKLFLSNIITKKEKYIIYLKKQKICFYSTYFLAPFNPFIILIIL